jgi:hypothetical protein
MTKITNPFTTLTDQLGNKYDVVSWEYNTHSPYGVGAVKEYTFTCRLSDGPEVIIERLHRALANNNNRIAMLEKDNQTLRDRINNASDALDGVDD